MDKILTTPIAFVIFNRPDTTRRVFEAIRKIRPSQLLIIADGARNKDEWAKCNEVRTITENIDWECRVLRNYSEINLGCKKRVSSGIDWVFENVDRAIILEDDCLPHESFFYYCEELLEKYNNNPRIMHISGDNFQAKNIKFIYNESYYFSVIAQIWGWATWRRAWKLYDLDMNSWPQIKASGALKNTLHSDAVVDRWSYLFQQHYENKINSWDGQWTYACLINNGLCIMPKVNLISNIGFGKDATHSKTETHEFANIPTCEIEIPLTHPRDIVANIEADKYTQSYVFTVNRYWGQKIRWFFKSVFPRSYHLLKKIHNNILRSY